MSDIEDDVQPISVDEAFGELLANYVRNNPCLYDKKVKEYKNRDFVQNTWASIAASLEMTVDEVMKSWKHLRSHFTREQKAQTAYTPSGSGSSRPRKPWYLYPAMSFLVEHVAHRRRQGNFTPSVGILPPSVESHDSNTAWCAEVESIFSGPSSSSASATATPTPPSTTRTATPTPPSSRTPTPTPFTTRPQFSSSAPTSSPSIPAPLAAPSTSATSSSVFPTSSHGTPAQYRSSTSAATKRYLTPPPDASATKK